MRKSCLEKGNECPFYSRALMRCKKGYVDPKRINDGVKAYRQGLMNPCPETHRGQRVIEKALKE